MGYGIDASEPYAEDLTKTASQAERDRPAVTVQLDRLGKTVEQVHHMRDRLSLVLRPQGPELAENVPAEKPNRISDRLGDAVNEINRVLADIEDRLEI